MPLLWSSNDNEGAQTIPEETGSLRIGRMINSRSNLDMSREEEAKYEEELLQVQTFERAVKLVPYHLMETRLQYRNFDFDNLYKVFLQQRREMSFMLERTFRKLGISMELSLCEDIVYCAQPPLTGKWYTTGSVILIQQKDGTTVIGKFLDFLIVGKLFDRDLIIHQYHPRGHVLTLWLQLDRRHQSLEGYFWRKWKPQQRSQITFQRKPFLYQRALNYASSGSLSQLIDLIRNENFDLNTQKKEAQMFTVLHAAVACNQPIVVYHLLQEGVDLKKVDENGESALRLARRFHFPHIVNLISAKLRNELPENLDMSNDFEFLNSEELDMSSPEVEAHSEQMDWSDT